MDNIDLRVIKTLEHIDLALLKNLSTFPFHKITIDMLCKDAQINRSTFYKYYYDKYDLLNKYLEKTLKELKININPSFINASPEQLTSQCYSDNFLKILEFFWARRYQYQILWHATIDRHVYNEMIDIIQQCLLKELTKEQTLSSQEEPYAVLYSFLFANNLISTIHWWYEYTETMPIEQVRKLMDNNMRMGLFKTFKQKTE